MNTSLSDVSRERASEVIDSGGESETSLSLNQDESCEKKTTDFSNPHRSESVSSSSDVTPVYKPEALLPRVPHVYSPEGVWRPPVSFPPSSLSPEHKPHLKDREMLDISYHGAVFPGYYSYGVPIPLHQLYSQYYTPPHPHLIPYALDSPLFPRELLPASTPSPEEYYRYYHTFVTPGYNQNHPHDRTHPAVPYFMPYSQIHHVTNMSSGFSVSSRYEAAEFSNVQHVTSENTYEERELRVNTEEEELQSPQTGCSAAGSPDGPHHHHGYQQPEDEETAPDSQSEERKVDIQIDDDGERQEEMKDIER